MDSVNIYCRLVINDRHHQNKLMYGVHRQIICNNIKENDHEIEFIQLLKMDSSIVVLACLIETEINRQLNADDITEEQYLGINIDHSLYSCGEVGNADKPNKVGLQNS
ncbi:hypothetical protein V1478_005674 [Vespula squamosa]|uniref:Uncharacterized protein n=1 Tax=Vespula squamosa TaxID=30214 RepID=A0ABD2B9G7_VESSQ